MFINKTNKSSLSTSIMSSQQNELHLIKTTISLKKISITVRFPCSISFALKHQNNLIDHRAIYELTKGECLINRTIDIELQVPCFRGKYEQKKISLLVYMVSSNGKMPAGSITINPTETIIMQRKAPLQKCPDKNAFAVITQFCERVKIIKNLQDKNRTSLASSIISSNYNHLRRSNVQSSSKIEQMEEQQGKIQQIQLFSPITKFAYGSQKRLSIEPPRLQLENIGRKSSFGSIKRQHLNSQRSKTDNRLFTDENDWESSSLKGKIKRFTHEKSKSRGSFVRIDSEVQLEDQFYRVNNEKSILEDELEMLKQTSKYHEKREKQSNNLMRELRQELNKKKSKIFQLDSSKNQIQEQLSQKQRKINFLQNQKKKLQQLLMQQKSLRVSFQKKIEAKQTSFKQQLKKLNEKTLQIDAQRQKVIFDFNNLLAEMQITQKKYQNSMKDKQKYFNEEKNKLSKKNDQLLSQNIILKSKVEENNSSLRQVQYNNKRFTEERRNLQDDINGLKITNERYANEINKYQQQLKTIKVQRKQIQQKYNGEKANFLQKISKLNEQLSTQKLTYEKIKIETFNSQKNNKYLQLKLEKQTKQKLSVISQLQQLKQILRQQKQQCAQRLYVQHLSINQRLDDCQQMLQQQKSKYQTMTSKYQQKIQYLISSNNFHQNQVQKLKLQLQQQHYHHQNLNLKHKQLGQLGERLIDINQTQVYTFQHKFDTYQHQKQEIINKVEGLEFEVVKYQQKIERIESDQKRLKLQNERLQNKNHENKLQIVILTKKMEIIQNQSHQKEKEWQKTIQGYKVKYNYKSQQINNLVNQLSQIKEMSNKRLSQLNHNHIHIRSLEDANNALKQEYRSLTIKYNETIEKQSQINRQLNFLLESRNQQANKTSNSLSQLQKTKLSFQQYKNKTNISLQQMFTLITKQELQNPKEVLKIYPLSDDRLTQLQIESLNKFKNIKRKKQQQIQSYKNQIKYLENQLAKLQAYIQKRQDDHLNQQIKLRNEKIRMQQQKKSLIDIHEGQISKMNSLISQSKGQVQSQRKEINRFESTILEMSDKINDYYLKQIASIKQIHILQEQIFAFKEKDMKEKLKEPAQSQNYLEIVAQLKRGIDEKEIVIIRQRQQIKKGVMSVETLKLKLLQVGQQVAYLNEKIENIKTDKISLQNHIKNQQKINISLQQQLIQSKQTTNHLYQELLSKDISYKQLLENYQQLESSTLSQKQLKNNHSTNTNETYQRQRQKCDKLEQIKNKLQKQNKQCKEKITHLQSQIKFYQFNKTQYNRKQKEEERLKQQNLSQVTKFKELIIACEKQNENYQTKCYRLQAEVQSIRKEKEMIQSFNNKLQQKISQFQFRQTQHHSTLVQLQLKQKQIFRLKQSISSTQQQTHRTSSQLRITISKLREQLALKTKRMKQLQQQQQSSSHQLLVQKQKWQIQLQNQKNIYELKMQNLDEHIAQLRNQLQFQKEQSVRQIQQVNSTIQELNQIIREKEVALEEKEQIINEQSVRLDELNQQLNQCVTKWEKQKESYLPTSNRLNQITDQITRINGFINELDGRNKQLLEINRRKLQSNIDNKPNITEMLKQLLLLLHKNKNRILNRCQTEKEKESVILDFKAIQEKIDLTIKSTQVVVVKQ